MHHEIVIALLISSILIGIAGAADITSTQFIYKMDQSVSGEGFYSSYQGIQTTPATIVPVGATGVVGASHGILNLDKISYGSGSYNAESTTTAINGATTDSSGNYVSTDVRNISFKETVNLAYAEKAFNEGKSFSAGPVRLLGKEETCIQNYAAGASMTALFDSASTLSKDLSANLYWKSTESGDKTDPVEDWYTLEQKALTKLNVDATFTGKGHIGALETDVTDPKKAPNHNINVARLIDEDYLGTYTISKKMTQEYNYKYTQNSAEWLSCCYNGWADMPAYAQKGYGTSAKGVFDCTCFKTQKTAQFPEPSEKKAW